MYTTNAFNIVQMFGAATGDTEAQPQIPGTLHAQHQQSWPSKF